MKITTPWYVKIHASRGFGNGLFKVIEKTGAEFRLHKQGESAKTAFTLYEAHTYQDAECGRTMVKEKQANAAKILNKVFA